MYHFWTFDQSSKSRENPPGATFKIVEKHERCVNYLTVLKKPFAFTSWPEKPRCWLATNLVFFYLYHKPIRFWRLWRVELAPEMVKKVKLYDDVNLGIPLVYNQLRIHFDTRQNLGQNLGKTERHFK